MAGFFEFLGANPFILLFGVVGGAVALGRVTIRGYGLGMVASAIVVGAAVATVASLHGTRLQLDDFTKSLFYYLFMYGVGLRVGPSFVNSLKGDGLKFTFLAVLCSLMGLAGAVWLAQLFDLPAGAAGGILAGAMTMSAAIGSAEQAVTAGVYRLAEGVTRDQVSGMIALSYGVTYIWGTIGIILICKYLPRWWGVDARAAALQYEREHGVPNVDDAGLTGYRPAGLRAYRLTNPQMAGKSVAEFRTEYPMYRLVNVGRHGEVLGAPLHLVLEKDDVIALGGRLEDLTDHMGLVGPEVPDARVLSIPLDQAEILVLDRAVVDQDVRALRETFRDVDFAGQLQVTRLERGGVPIPIGLDTTLRRMDVLSVVGLKAAVDKAAATFGKVARPSTATDLLTLATGMILGLLIGQVEVTVAGSGVGLGNAGGLLVSGVIVSSVVSRLRFFGNTPNAARNILEDLGLVTFISIVGVNAGATLLEQLTGSVAAHILLAGFIVTTVPPIIVWALGYHLFRINPAVLMGGVAGARSHSGPAREAAKEIGSSVPWIGFPVGYAVSGVLLTVFGYFAMVLSQ
jgi:putative transport protein